MNITRSLALAVGLACVAVQAAATPAADPELKIYVPAFSGDRNMGRNVSTLLNLQIWRTLRRAPSPNPNALNFGSGMVVWDPEPLEDDDPAAVWRNASEAGQDMVLWGTTNEYGDGVVVRAYLLARPTGAEDAPHGAVWRLEVAGERIELGLPRQFFEFGTVVMRPQIVARFSLPSALRLCRDIAPACRAPRALGNSLFRAHEHRGTWSLVSNDDGARGWVRLEELGAEQNEIGAFTGALISYYRGDLEQAGNLFAAVSNISSADPLVREDAAILVAAARSRLGRPASSDIDSVLRANPYSRFAVQVRVMDALAHFDPNSSASVSRLRDVAADFRATTGMFEPDDDWFRKATAILTALGV